MLEILKGLNHWQIDLLATGLLLQGAIFAVFPEEIIILTLGLLWGQGKVNFWEALLFTQLGLLPANAAMVLIGKKLGSRSFIRKKGVQAALKSLERYGAWLILITRFTPLIRGPVYLAVGCSRFPFLSFVRIDAWASCIQISLLLLLGRRLGVRSGSLQAAYEKVGFYSTTVMISMLLTFAWRELRRQGQASDLGVSA